MSYYNIHPLPIPPGFVGGTPVKINSHGLIAGTCYRLAGPTSAIAWNGLTSYNVIGPTAFYTHATDINSNGILVGNYVDSSVKNIPFYWGPTIGLTLLNTPVQNSNSAGATVAGINDSNELAGTAYQNNLSPSEECLFWSALNSNPVVFGNNTLSSINVGINKNGIIIGSMATGSGNQAFFGDSATQQIAFIPFSNYCVAINDLSAAQILFYRNTTGLSFYKYDTGTGLVFDLNIPGNDCVVSDINNNGDIVGSINNEAVLWQGLIRIRLNSVAISDAKLKGWTLTQALSINGSGHIVGVGMFGGKEMPFLLVPKLKKTWHPIPVEYMLPHFVWPGDPYDQPRPKGWPKGFPFPPPEPSPFELVGETYKIKQELTEIYKIEQMAGLLSDKKEGLAIGKITNRLLQQKSKKLYSLLEKSLMPKNNTRK